MTRTLPVFTRKDVHLCDAAASHARHAPRGKHAGHMAARLEDLGRRIAATLPEDVLEFPVPESIPLEALDMGPEDVPA